MHSVPTITPTNTRHIIPPDTYRTVVLARRIDASDAVASLIAELAFGHIERDHVTMLPASVSGREMRL